MKNNEIDGWVLCFRQWGLRMLEKRRRRSKVRLLESEGKGIGFHGLMGAILRLYYSRVVQEPVVAKSVTHDSCLWRTTGALSIAKLTHGRETTTRVVLFIQQSNAIFSPIYTHDSCLVYARFVREPVVVKSITHGSCT